MNNVGTGKKELLKISQANIGIIIGAVRGGVKGAFLGLAMGALNVISSIHPAVAAVVIGVGLALSYATGGWKGVAMFSAAALGAYAGSRAGQGFGKGGGGHAAGAGAAGGEVGGTAALAGTDGRAGEMGYVDVGGGITTSLTSGGYHLPDGLSLPLNIDISQNVANARTMSSAEFYHRVESKGEWDYKTQGSIYENFGNYHYGLVGSANGWSPSTLKAFAGLYQVKSNTASIGWYGSYFDDPIDQFWIQRGIEDYNKYFK